MMVIAWIIAIAAWAVILLGPPALVAVAVVPRWRRWALRPLSRRRAARRHRAWLARQVVIQARTAQLEAELEAAGLESERPATTRRARTEPRLDSAPGTGDATAVPGTCPPELAGGPVETLAIRVLIAVLGVAVSARTRLTAVVAGQAYSVPVLLVVAVVVVLLLVAAVLLVARSIVRDGGLRLRPVPS